MSADIDWFVCIKPKTPKCVFLAFWNALHFLHHVKRHNIHYRCPRELNHPDCLLLNLPFLHMLVCQKMMLGLFSYSSRERVFPGSVWTRTFFATAQVQLDPTIIISKWWFSGHHLSSAIRLDMLSFLLQVPTLSTNIYLFIIALATLAKCQQYKLDLQLPHIWIGWIIKAHPASRPLSWQSQYFVKALLPNGAGAERLDGHIHTGMTSYFN